MNQEQVNAGSSFFLLPAETMGDSLNDYVLRGRSKGVWAFRYSNTQTVMKNILDITAGDTVILLIILNMEKE